MPDSDRIDKVVTEAAELFVKAAKTRADLMVMIDLLTARMLIASANGEVIFAFMGSEMHKAHVDMFLDSWVTSGGEEPTIKDTKDKH